MAFSFFESAACAKICGCGDTRGPDAGGHDEPGCGHHRRRIGMGLASRPTPRGERQSSRAARPRRRRGDRTRPRTCAASGSQRSGSQVDVTDRAAVDDAHGRGAQRVRTDRDHGHQRRVRRVLGPFTDITPEAWERMLAVNLTGTFHCLQAAIPDMLAGGWGRIVTISSSSAQSGAARMAHYVASKGGVVGLDEGVGRRVRAQRHHRQHDPARLHRHADGAPRPKRAATCRASTRSRPALRYAAPEHRTTSRPRARSSAPTTPATSPGQMHRRERRLVPVSEMPSRRVSRRCPADDWGDDVRAALATGLLRRSRGTLPVATGPDADPVPNVRSPRSCTTPRSPGRSSRTTTCLLRTQRSNRDCAS